MRWKGKAICPHSEEVLIRWAFFLLRIRKCYAVMTLLASQTASLEDVAEAVTTERLNRLRMPSADNTVAYSLSDDELNATMK